MFDFKLRIGYVWVMVGAPMSCKYLTTSGKPCRCGQLADDGRSHYDCVGPTGSVSPSGTPFVMPAFKEACAAAAEAAFVDAIVAALAALPDRDAAVRVIKTVCRQHFGVQVEL